MKKCIEDYSLIEIIAHLIKLNKLHHFYETEKILKGAPQELKNGQIYLHDHVGNSRIEGGKYYLLRAHQTSGNWILIDINNPEFAWCSWNWTSGMEEIIKYNFTLCPHAQIVIIGDKNCCWTGDDC